LYPVTWAKPFSGWHNLDTAILPASNVFGVYVIWHGGNPTRVVTVGQGQIANRLNAHRNDKAITAYRQYGGLWVMWAAVPAPHVDGVERFLANHYRPLVGDRYPDVAPIVVNLP
jgi:hypothetical protein